MFERLDDIEKRFADLTGMLSDPVVLSDQNRSREVAKERSRLEPLVLAYGEWRRVDQEMAGARELLENERDAELRAMADDELKTLKARKEELEERLTVLLLPRDPNDEKNVIVEIRAGTGGGEAALFAAELYRSYTRYAERQRWGTELVSSTPTDIGGFKEVIFVIEGEGAYSRLKYESGVHRVQRVPETESSGRIHTSTSTVAVLPEAEEVEIDIGPNDLQIDTYCAGGPGGQHVNKTASAVRITHIPTGIVATCQDEKSQHKNRDKAMRVLRARLLAKAQEEQHEEVAQQRRSQVGTGDRSERIRTYNFPQTRVTDHRIGLTTHKLALILDGDLDEIIDALATSVQTEQLRKAE
jgi:peptide chain release factor 1